jgi:hypothetical protein
MNYIINKVQHFVGVDPFLRPSVVEEQFRILYLVSGDSSDLCFSSENSVFAAQVHMQILRVRDPLEEAGPHRICPNISKNLPGTVTEDSS